MPKKKKTQQAGAKKLLLITIGLVALFLVPLFTVKTIKQVILESKFRKLDRDISMIINEFSNLGIRVEENKYCYNNAVVFGKGPLNCVIGIEFKENINQENINQVKDIFEKNNSWVNSRDLINGEKPTNSILYKNLSSNINCEGNYIPVNTSGKEKLFNVGLVCSKHSEKAFYPLKTQ